MGSPPGRRSGTDYAGKSLPDYDWWEGTQYRPQLIAVVLPDGTTRYTRYERNGWGLPTQIVTTYSSGGGIATRTNTFTYDATGTRLLSIVGPDGYVRVGYAYDTQFPNLIKSITNYASSTQGYVTAYSYDATSGRLASRVTPAGLTTTLSVHGWLSDAGR